MCDVNPWKITFFSSLRVFVRVLRFFSCNPVPIIRNLAFGFCFVTLENAWIKCSTPFSGKSEPT